MALRNEYEFDVSNCAVSTKRLQFNVDRLPIKSVFVSNPPKLFEHVLRERTMATM